MGGQGSGKRKKMGAPTKLTKELSRELVKWVQAGNYMETAAAVCGVDRITVRRWIREGARAKSGLKRDFRNAIKKAEAQAQAHALTRLRSHGGKSWQADAWFLERKWPEHWGRREPKDEKPSANGPRTLGQMADELNLAALTTSELASFLKLVRKASEGKVKGDEKQGKRS